MVLMLCYRTEWYSVPGRLTFFLTLLELQSRFGDIPLKFQVVCPQNGTAVLTVVCIPGDVCTRWYLKPLLLVVTHVVLLSFVVAGSGVVKSPDGVFF